MNNYIVENFDNFCICLENGEFNKKYKNILENSVFYYCSGKDITPIFALKDKFNMYVYADKVNYGRGDFESELNTLYSRLKKEKFSLEKDIKINLDKKFNNAKLSLWKTKEDNYFLLLFIQGDAKESYRYVYENNYFNVIPKCICNIKYEMNTSYFLTIEKCVKYILGDCYNREFVVIDSFDYKGDYTMTKKVNFYENPFFEKDENYF